MTPSNHVELVGRLLAYVAAIVTVPEAPQDLRVGKAMCANAMSEAADELIRLNEMVRVLGEQREDFIRHTVAASEAMQRAEAWLRECSDWLLETDLDMQCPMETDPLDLADDLRARIKGDTALSLLQGEMK